MLMKNKLAPQETEAVRTLRALQADPSLMATQQAKSEAGRTVISLPSKTNFEIMSEIYVPQVKGYNDLASSANNFAREAQTISELLKGKGGGEAVKIGVDLARALGLGDKETVAAADLAESLSIRGATTMRPIGSGSTSDLEFNAYRMAFPSLKNSDQGRQLMAKYAEKFASRQRKVADYATKLLGEGKYSMEAISAYDNSLGSVLGDDFKEFINIGKPTQQGNTLDFRSSRPRGGQ
jgi:hypothetical protein